MSGLAATAMTLPIGPLCPFRSEFWSAEAVNNYAAEMPMKQRRLSELMSKLQQGTPLTPEEQSEMCRDMRESNDMWLATNFRLRRADDFQALETFALTEVRMQEGGLSMDAVEALMKWQPEQMAAMLEGRPPPPLPAGLSPAAIQQMSQSLPSVMSATSSDAGPTSPPFTANARALESTVVQDELEALTRDHEGLIRFGGKYRDFDPLGKQAYLDQVALIQERWRVFIGRFQLLGELNPDYVAESERYLQSVGMTIDQFHENLQATHDKMRADAEDEGLKR